MACTVPTQALIFFSIQVDTDFKMSSSGKDNPAYVNDEYHDDKLDIKDKPNPLDEDEDYEDPKLHRYGWGSCRPGFLQCCHNPKGYLFFLCVYVFVQGMVANGLVFVSISTLERRFGFTSARSGMVYMI